MVGNGSLRRVRECGSGEGSKQVSSGAVGRAGKVSKSLDREKEEDGVSNECARHVCRQLRLVGVVHVACTDGQWPSG